MAGIKGIRYGIRTIDDLRERSVIAECGCWKRPATMNRRKDRNEDPSIWISDEQQALALGSGIYFLQNGKRLRKGFCYVRTCDTWGCANPEHRRVMSFQTLARRNTRPCSAQRRIKVAEARRRSSPFTDEIVQAVRESTLPAAQAAELYGMSKAYVYMLRRYQCRNPAALFGPSILGARP